MNFKYRIYYLLVIMGLILSWSSCKEEKQVKKHQPLTIDFTINGKKNILATNAYAGTPSFEDTEKVMQVNLGESIQFEALVNPSNRVNQTRWYIGEDNFSKTLKGDYIFEKEGLIEIQFCVNEGYRCVSKYIFVKEGAIPIPIDVDTDGDGILDKEDKCPTEKGVASKNGCPDNENIPPPPPPIPTKDTDGDGITDNLDNCPNKFGPQSNNGCPLPSSEEDSDNDGIKDNEDNCPNLPGLSRFNGCPDDDGDGIPSPIDKCPTEKGISPDGCPRIEDADGDGLSDNEDNCPSQFGPKSNKGCPLPKDRDNDGIPDKDDKCPTEKGEAAYGGCPPPPPCDIARSGTIGILTADRCPQSTFVNNGKIKIQPKRCIELEGGVLYANDEGKVKIYITSSSGEKSEVLTKKINSGRSQIAGLEELFILLKANETYYLHIEPQKNDKDRIPQLENISGCNPTVLPNDNLAIDYNGNFIIMDLKYAY